MISSAPAFAATLVDKDDLQRSGNCVARQARFIGDPELCSEGWGPSWVFELAEASAREMKRSTNVSMMIGVEVMISAILG